MSKRLLFLLLFLPALFNAVALLAGAVNFTQSNLPIILLTTPNGVAVPGKFADPIVGTMKIIDNGPGKINHITDTPAMYNGYMEINVRGNSSAYYPQQPYAITTVDSSDNNVNAPLFNFPADEDWVMVSLYNDRSFIRNLLAYKMSSEMGHYTSRSTLCEVMLNGNYQGVYMFGEKITQDPNRINITRLSANAATLPSITGGYIFKVDAWDDTTEIWTSDFNPVDDPTVPVVFSYEYPKSSKINQYQKAYIRGFVDSFQATLLGPNMHDSLLGYSKYIDPVTFADYGIVNEIARNPDGFKKSYYFYKDNDAVDKRIKNVPVWDFDWAFKIIPNTPVVGNTDGSGWIYNVNTINGRQDVESPAFMVSLMTDCKFVHLFHDRYDSFRKSIINTAVINNYIDSMAGVLKVDSAAYRHFTRWGTLGVQGPTPEPDPLPTTYDGEIANLKSFISTRMNWLDANIPNCPVDTIAADSSSINIYPNPVSKQFYVDLDTSLNIQQATIIIYDIAGRLRANQTLYSVKEQTVNIGSLQSGIYIVRIFLMEVDGRSQVYQRKIFIN